jgi:hypothetical protein
MSNQKEVKETNTRAEKGLVLAGLSHVRKIEPRTTKAQLYKVLSEKTAIQYNVIEHSNGELTCDCQDFKQRQTVCKHQWAVIFTETQDANDLKAYAFVRTGINAQEPKKTYKVGIIQ